MGKKDFSKFKTLTPLDKGVLEEVTDGGGDGAYTVPHCPNCRSYDIGVHNGRGYCEKCQSIWSLEAFHQSVKVKETIEDFNDAKTKALDLF